MARIVILAQASELYELVGRALVQDGHRVYFLHDWRESLVKINRLLPNIVIVDAGNSLPMAEQLCARMRKRHTVDRSHILIVRPPGDRVDGKHCAFPADTYLERPLQPYSFFARVRELLTHKTVDDTKRQIVVGDIVIDPVSFQVTRSGAALSVTLSEFELLYYLASHPNVVYRRDQLLDVVWGNPRVTPRTVDVFVRQLRKKLEEDPEKPRLILSVRGQGYRFHIAPPSARSPAKSGPAVNGLEHAQTQRKSR